jgi:hypothetical protein
VQQHHDGRPGHDGVSAERGADRPVLAFGILGLYLLAFLAIPVALIRRRSIN